MLTTPHNPQSDTIADIVNEDDPIWGIQEFARLFDVTPRALRFYEDKGLLSPARIGGARQFCRRDYHRLVQILRAKRLGFRLEDIKIVMDVMDGQVRARPDLLQYKANFEQVISGLKRRRQDIDIIIDDMTNLCADIENFTKTNMDPEGIFAHAMAYDKVFRQTMVEQDILENTQIKNSSE